ncbi:hypothetical protein V5O48_008001 [Marasmius crinis-equi]|uniref:F-box domain-containing protein n=1 Tax=Marasmius crinis-equi TaxID=585013 RepID=A0ABR3FF93_9AGAR
MSSLFEHCTLTGLESLSITKSPSETEIWHFPWNVAALRSLTLRSSCSLTSLHLRYVPIADVDFISLLQLTPALTSLHIAESFPDTYYINDRVPTNVIVTPYALKRLSLHHEPVEDTHSRASPPGMLIPRLHNLVLDLHGADLDPKALVGAIVSRCPGMSRSGGRMGSESDSLGSHPCLRSIKILVTTRGDTSAFDILLSLECFRDVGMKVNIDVAHEDREPEGSYPSS